jgi:hypothetical protein
MRTFVDPDVAAHVHPPVCTAVADDAPATETAVTCASYFAVSAVGVIDAS